MLAYLWKCPECECALDLADMVLQDVRLREGLRQVETVFNLQALAHRALLGARAHGARGDALSVT